MDGVLLSCVLLTAGVALAAVACLLILIRGQHDAQRAAADTVNRALDVARHAPTAQIMASFDLSLRCQMELLESFADKAMAISDDARALIVDKGNLENVRANLELEKARAEIARLRRSFGQPEIPSPPKDNGEVTVRDFSDSPGRGGGDRGAPV